MTQSPINRRQLFRGDLRGSVMPFRPPWAGGEVVFVDGCDRCGDCVPACPEHIIRIGSGGFPVVDFAFGGCSFCGDCVSVCAGKALAGDPQTERPWTLVAGISDGCLVNRGVVCRSCGEVCDTGAICFRLRVGGAAEPVLQPDLCSGCGFCVGLCPAQAVTMVAVKESTPAAGRGIKACEHL